MKTNQLINILLWILVIIGLLGAAKVSLANFNGVACPNILFVPICYLVMLGYALMFGSLIINHSSCKHHFFCAGWGIAFTIALFGSLAELFFQGGICPSTSSGGIRAGSAGGIPLCYISLIMLIVILILFIMGSNSRACEIHNAG